MKLRFVPASRIPHLPVWALLVVGLWGALQAGTVLISLKMHRSVVTCPLKLLTGFPCPTCGATRGVLHLIAGDILAGMLCNPLLFVSLGLVALALGLRAAFARTVRVDLTPGQRRIAWIVAAGAVLVNWAYVIRWVG